MQNLFVLLILFAAIGCRTDEHEKLQVQGDTLKVNNSHFRYAFAYPVVKGNKKINRAIDSIAEQETSSFEKNAYRWCNREFGSSSTQTFMEGYYKIIENTGNLFSVKWFIFVNWSGSDLPSHYFATLNVQPKTGKIIDIETFASTHFSSRDAAAAVLTKEIAKRVNNAHAYYCHSLWLDEHSLEDFAYINLKQDTVMFTFDEYIQGTSTCGTPEVEIPMNELTKTK